MEPRELELRNPTYGLLRELGRAPTAAEVATRLGLAVDDVLEGWRRLDAQHAIVLDRIGAALRMLHPFSAVPTAYRVRAADRWWYANCAWDAFGVCAALAADGRIETRCPDRDEPLELEVRDGRPDDETLVFHALVPGGVVGRHRLHLKHHDPLPVGGARRAVARGTEARRDDPGRHARRPRERLVARPAVAGLATSRSRRESTRSSNASG